MYPTDPMGLNDAPEIVGDQGGLQIQAPYGSPAELQAISNNIKKLASTYIKDKKLGFYKDSKLELEEYLKSFEKGYIEYVNKDGHMEKWVGADFDKMKEFWSKELKFIDEQLELLEKEKK